MSRPELRCTWWRSACNVPRLTGAIEIVQRRLRRQVGLPTRRGPSRSSRGLLRLLHTALGLSDLPAQAFRSFVEQ